jgi:GNAT superfamily N-acetyltransferase
VTRTLDGKVVRHQRIEYSSARLDPDHLDHLKSQLPAQHQIRRFDRALVQERGLDLDRQGLAFLSIRQFLQNGISYWVIKDGEVVSEATSEAMSGAGIEIEIGTDPDHQGQGLATAVGATLLSDCLERELEPHWTTTSNPRSDGLARKLGYVVEREYDVVAYTG